MMGFLDPRRPNRSHERHTITFLPIYFCIGYIENNMFQFAIIYSARWARGIIFGKLFKQEIVQRWKERFPAHKDTATVVDIIDSFRSRRNSTYENYNFPDSAKVS